MRLEFKLPLSERAENLADVYVPPYHRSCGHLWIVDALASSLVVRRGGRDGVHSVAPARARLGRLLWSESPCDCCAGRQVMKRSVATKVTRPRLRTRKPNPRGRCQRDRIVTGLGVAPSKSHGLEIHSGSQTWWTHAHCADTEPTRRALRGRTPGGARSRMLARLVYCPSLAPFPHWSSTRRSARSACLSSSFSSSVKPWSCRSLSRFALSSVRLLSPVGALGKPR
jgi:hypothetical protein